MPWAMATSNVAAPPAESFSTPRRPGDACWGRGAVPIDAANQQGAMSTPQLRQARNTSQPWREANSSVFNTPQGNSDASVTDVVVSPLAPILSAETEETSATASATPSRRRNRRRSERSERLRQVAAVLRPQLRFDPLPDNSAAPFCIKRYNADIHLWVDGEEEAKRFAESARSFRPLPSQLTAPQPFAAAPAALERSECHWIDTQTALEELCAHVQSSRITEIAVSVESHSYRSFQGFICLLQISLRDGVGYIIDALELHNAMYLLQPLFANPGLVKVVFNAEQLVPWLQRDFGIFVVNLWDIGVAALALNQPQRPTLSSLLTQYYSIPAEKRLPQQDKADWRMRPVPYDMVWHARENVHYLLDLADRFSSLLFQQGRAALLGKVINQCRELSLQRYQKEKFDLQSAVDHFLSRHKPNFGPTQLAVLRSLLVWRDQTARAEDESAAYVVPSQMLLNTCRMQPATEQELFRCFSPIPSLVKRDASMLVNRIQAAVQSIRTTPVTPQHAANVPMSPSLSLAVAASAASPVPCDGYGSSPVGHCADNLTAPQSPVLSTEQLYQLAGWVETPSTENSVPAVIPPPASTTPTCAGKQNSDSAPPPPLPHASHAGTAHIRPNFFTKSPSPEGPSTLRLLRLSAGGSPAPASPSPSSEHPHSPMPDIPRSLNEIYSLSQQKKRAKDKKKLKEDSIADPSSVFFSNSSGEEEDNPDPGEKAKGAQDTRQLDMVDFMVRIGWVREGEIPDPAPPPPPPPQPQSQSQPQPSAQPRPRPKRTGAQQHQAQPQSQNPPAQQPPFSQPQSNAHQQGGGSRNSRARQAARQQNRNTQMQYGEPSSFGTNTNRWAGNGQQAHPQPHQQGHRQHVYPQPFYYPPHSHGMSMT
eukprot:TRINITY_DN8817_c0_g1_i1.p1 TRINITY_DN8817_c0_g1~~TRINITY_DN8817_c0_g1_i1.p1  ORF type:complete len:877 (-),score=103.90 TRINITY_DN8817_c0_g1_i1:404-3034(-)